MTRLFGFLLPSLSLTLALPALAQDAGDDWDLHQDSRRGLTQAVLAYEGAPTLTARCTAGVLEVAIDNLAPTGAETRDLSLQYGDITLSHWRAFDGGAVTSLNPRALRTLMAGGDLVLTVRDSAPPRRYRLSAPTMSAVIGQVLTACGAALSSEHDAMYSVSDQDLEDRPSDLPQASWVQHPTSDYPEAARLRGVKSGRVTLNCHVTSAGRLRDCIVETEYPVGFGFSAEALRSTRNARLTPPPEGASEADSRAVFTQTWRLD